MDARSPDRAFRNGSERRKSNAAIEKFAPGRIHFLKLYEYSRTSRHVSLPDIRPSKQVYRRNEFIVLMDDASEMVNGLVVLEKLHFRLGEPILRQISVRLEVCREIE